MKKRLNKKVIVSFDLILINQIGMISSQFLKPSPFVLRLLVKLDEQRLMKSLFNKKKKTKWTRLPVQPLTSGPSSQSAGPRAGKWSSVATR